MRGSIITHSAEGNFAIRQGPWKYIEGQPAVPMERVPAARRDEMKPQLYNLVDDPGEQKNLLDQYPEVVGRMKDLLSTSRVAGHTR